MGRNPSNCKEIKLRKGLWSPEEDEKLFNHIMSHGVGCWSNVPKQAGKCFISSFRFFFVTVHLVTRQMRVKSEK